MSFMTRGTNASSGLPVADESTNTFLELKKKKVHRYVIYKIDEEKNEVVENDCRYAIYDFDFVTSENCRKSKIFFLAWSPATSRVRAKVLYATSKHSIKSALYGVHYEIQATDRTEMDLAVITDRAR